MPEDDARRTRPVPPAGAGLALAIAWSEGAPERVGEVAFLSAAPRVLGRGGPAEGDPFPRLGFVRERGGVIEPCAPLASPHLSRVQLQARVRADGGVDLENVGRLTLSHRGTAVKTAVGRVGDVFELGAQLLLLIVSRPVTPTRSLERSFAFGGPDAHGLVGESVAAWALRDAIAFIGAQAGHVLVHGASGTGKELVARALHASSPSAQTPSAVAAPMIARNAATFPDALIDAELFGNARNYPNVGMPERRGLVGEADGGMLFLDEFAELPPAMQAHLLRVLDAGEYQRLGEARARTARFRLVAATNRPLAAVKEDVLARLVHRIELPGLERRLEDVPLIAQHLVRRMAETSPEVQTCLDAAGNPRLSMALVRAMLERTYTTNVRELEGLLWRAAAKSRGGVLEPVEEDLAAPGREPHAGAPGDLHAGASADLRAGASADLRAGASADLRAGASADLHAGVGALTAERIQASLDENNGALEATWRALGLSSRYALMRLIKKHRLEVRKRSRR